jgi:hypothetical protein
MVTGVGEQSLQATAQPRPPRRCVCHGSKIRWGSSRSSIRDDGGIPLPQ